MKHHGNMDFLNSILNNLMTDNKFSLAATELLSRRVAGTKAPRLPADIRPETIEEALLVQEQMAAQRNDSIGGWKCLLPFDDKVIVGPIFSDTVQTGAVCHLLVDKNKARVEPEIVFVLNKDLPAKDTDYTEDEINAAIGSCHMALELMQSRFTDDTDAEFPEKLADVLLNQGLFIGPEIDREKAFTASNINLTFTQGDIIRNMEGTHPNPLPHLPVYWLINYMSKRGTSFIKGQALTTGSYKGIVDVDFDIETTIAYEGIGEYKVTFKQL